MGQHSPLNPEDVRMKYVDTKEIDTVSEEKTAPVIVPVNTEPQLGHIWCMDKHSGKNRRSGGVKGLVVTKMVPPMDEREKELANMGHISNYALDFALDITDMKRYPAHRLNTVGDFEPNILDVVGDHSCRIVNLPGVRRLDDLLDNGVERKSLCVIVMTGGSLKRTAETVRNIDRTKVDIIGVNSAVLQIECDYHFVLDRRVRLEWALEGARQGASVVASLMVPPETIEAYPENRRYVYGIAGSHPVNNLIRSASDGNSNLHSLVELSAGVNVGCTALHFAYLMGYRHIAIVGMDVCWDEQGSLHWKKDVNGLIYDTPEDVKTLQVVLDDGTSVYAKCRSEYLRAYAVVMGLAYWILKSGKAEVYNCTGEGIIWQYPEAQCIWGDEVRTDIYGVKRVLSPMASYKLEQVLSQIVR